MNKNELADMASTLDDRWDGSEETARTIEFIRDAGDAEVLAFLRRLPMVAENEDGKPITLKHLIYEMKLWPFVKTAWAQVEASPGVVGRLKQIAQVYKHAENEMKKMTGDERGQPRVINIPAFLQANIANVKGTN